MCVCDSVCVCRVMEKRLTQHYCTVGNRPGTTDTEVPRVLGSTVSHLEINENIFQEEHHGLSPLKWAVDLPEDEDSGQS